MSCLAGIGAILIWLIILCAVVAIARILLAYASVPPVIVQIANVLLWAVIAIACIYIVFELLGCAVALPRLR